MHGRLLALMHVCSRCTMQHTGTLAFMQLARPRRCLFWGCHALRTEQAWTEQLWRSRMYIFTCFCAAGTRAPMLALRASPTCCSVRLHVSAPAAAQARALRGRAGTAHAWHAARAAPCSFAARAPVRAEPRQPRRPGLGLPLCGPPAGAPPALRPALGLRSICRAPALARVRLAAADVQSEASIAEQEAGASPPGAAQPGAWEDGRPAAADAASEEAGPPKDARGSEVAPGAVWEAVRAEAGAGAAPSARPDEDEGGGGQGGAGEEPDSAGAAWLARIGGRWGVDMPSTAAGWRTRALSYVRDSFLIGYTTIVRAGGRAATPRCFLERQRPASARFQVLVLGALHWVAHRTPSGVRPVSCWPAVRRVLCAINIYTTSVLWKTCGFGALGALQGGWRARPGCTSSACGAAGGQCAGHRAAAGARRRAVLLGHAAAGARHRECHGCARGAARCWAGPPGRLRGGCPVGARLRSAAHWLCAAGNCDVS